jgi:hypothetical protein
MLTSLPYLPFYKASSGSTIVQGQSIQHEESGEIGGGEENCAPGVPGTAFVKASSTGRRPRLHQNTNTLVDTLPPLMCQALSNSQTPQLQRGLRTLNRKKLPHFPGVRCSPGHPSIMILSSCRVRNQRPLHIIHTLKMHSPKATQAVKWLAYPVT